MEPKSQPPQNDKQRAATVALSAAMLLAALGTSIANIALPALAGDFGAPFGDVQAVVVAYLAGLTAAVIVAGQLGDRWGLKTMLMWGLALFSAASLLCALAPTLWLLVAARALQGTGAAFLMTLAMALMRQTAGEAHVGRAMGLLGTMSALGTALGPTLGGVLVPLAGWRGVFWVQVPLALVTLLLVMAKLPYQPAERRPRVSSLRSGLRRSLLPMLSANVLVAAVMMATLVIGPFYLALAVGLGPASVGLVMAAGPAISIVSGVPSGRLVDHWGNRRVTVLGLALLAGGSMLLAYLPAIAGLAGYLLGIAVLTPGYQLFQAANNTAALAKVEPDRRGTASGLLSLSRNLGLIAGAALMGAVFAYGLGADGVARASGDALAVGMNHTFLLAAAMMVLALAFMRASREGI